MLLAAGDAAGHADDFAAANGWGPTPSGAAPANAADSQASSMAIVHVETTSNHIPLVTTKNGLGIRSRLSHAS